MTHITPSAALAMSYKVCNKYILLTGRAIRGNIPFEIDHIGPTEGRDDTEVKNPILPDQGIAIAHLLYNFHIAIGMGNNERAILENIAL